MGMNEDEMMKKASQLNEEEERIVKRESQLNEKELELKERELRIKRLEMEASLNAITYLDDEFQIYKKKLDGIQNEVAEAWRNNALETEKIRKREEVVVKAEMKLKNDFSEERLEHLKALEAEKEALRQEIFRDREEGINKLQKELAVLESARMETLDEEIKRKHSEADAEIKRKHSEAVVTIKAERQDFDAATKQERIEINEERLEIKKLIAKMEVMKEENEANKTRLEMRRDRLDEREEDLNEEVQALLSKERKVLDSRIASLEKERDALLESIRESDETIRIHNELKKRLGDKEPEIVLKELKEYIGIINQQKEELLNRPTYESAEMIESLKLDRDRLLQANAALEQKFDEQITAMDRLHSLDRQVLELERDNKSLERQVEGLRVENVDLTENLRRLQSTYEKAADRDKRIAAIMKPHFTNIKPRVPDTVMLNEKDWLDNIWEKTKAYGFKFPKRILYAFHTSLKIAEWSPMTVLAGVSGTGKSELPRLYAHFGGINFMNLPVQPNWDSQESMLGYFNSIDNAFDAQPVLNYLVQTQSDLSSEDYDGFFDAMNIVLLDEMNLAHVELYFAEFLSKLETRRGKSGNDVPKLEIKLGSHMAPYELTLGRNVMWVGTMNQDETTKSLSDKVLDRGIVINFPRPNKLESRQWQQLGEASPLLARKNWMKWIVRQVDFPEDEIMAYKSFIEEMNRHLSKVGRALGHRVWQSIEYYMANYPDVIEAQESNDSVKLTKAMKEAFEDQLVQKVMPKLRGIETRGRARTECLDKIQQMLVTGDYSIVNDFDHAMMHGYGQFMWNSAMYIFEEDMEDGELIDAQFSEAVEGVDKMEADSTFEEAIIEEMMVIGDEEA